MSKCSEQCFMSWKVLHKLGVPDTYSRYTYLGYDNLTL